ncbi:MAG: hypothetical protein ABMB14_11470 [Myxococcota bacterium]
MFRFVLALSAVSCATLDPSAPADGLPDGWTAVDAGEDRRSFALVFDQGALVPGDVVPFTVTGAAPNDTVRFVFSTAGAGPGPCIAQLGGLCLGVLGPVTLMGSAVADGAGTAVLDVNVPANAPAIFLFTQAVIDRGAGSVGTNVITAPVLTGSLDVDGDGYCGGTVCADPATPPGDCQDDDPEVNPGIIAPRAVPYLTASGGTSFDWNCDGVEQETLLDEYRCQANGGAPACPHQDGWDFNFVPTCGEVGQYSEGCLEVPFIGICVASFTDYLAQPCL